MDKLSQLFQLKKDLERPGDAFWEVFDLQLQQKLQARKVAAQSKVHYIDWQGLWQQRRRFSLGLRTFAYGTVACGFALLFLFQIHSPLNNRPLATTTVPTMRSTGDSITLPKNWFDTTLAFNTPKRARVHYVCDRIYTSALNSSAKELVF
jgi:hypothetical protein